MSGQNKIMYSSMDQFYDQTNGRMAEWVSQLEPWVKACENLGKYGMLSRKKRGVC